jgi:hypothetical protein
VRTTRSVVALRLAALAIGVIAVVSCSSRPSSVSQDNPPNGEPTATTRVIPRGLQSACGHPGAVVVLRVRHLPVTISHARCDLRGVYIRWNQGGDQVPGGDGEHMATVCDQNRPGHPGCPSISVNFPTMDVTIRRVG